MTINTDINYEVFGMGEFPVDETLLNNLTFDQIRLAKEMMSSGVYGNGLYIWRFLNTDLTINLEKLEFAVTLAVTMLEANTDGDATLNLRGLDDYYKIRNIEENEKQQREERTFLLGFISAIAAEASKRDTLEVKYVR
jgi:hypothetical protein